MLQLMSAVEACSSEPGDPAELSDLGVRGMDCARPGAEGPAWDMRKSEMYECGGVMGGTLRMPIPEMGKSGVGNWC